MTKLRIRKFELVEDAPPQLTDHSLNAVALARKEAGLTIKALCKISGYSIGVLQAVEENRSQVSENMARALKSALPKLDIEALLRNDEHPSSIGVEIATVGTKTKIRLPEGSKGRYIPLISWAQAGQLTGFEDTYGFEGKLLIDAKDPRAFAIGIRGDSMPPWSEGDWAIVYPSEPILNGKLVIGKTHDDEVFFKMLTILERGKYRFSSFNPVYQPFDRAEKELVWIYRVASVHMNTL